MKKRLLALLLCLTMLAGNLAVAESVEQPEIPEVTGNEETVVAVEVEDPAAEVEETAEETAEEPAEEQAGPEATEEVVEVVEETVPETEESEETAPEAAEEEAGQKDDEVNDNPVE